MSRLGRGFPVQPIVGPRIPPPEQIISPAGIATAEAFGSDTITTLATISPAGIASAEALGAAQVNLVVAPTGIASAGAFGTAQLNLTIYPTGITSAGAFGTAAVGLVLYPSGIASAEAFGTDTVTPGGVTVSPAGITSAEAFGTAQLNLTIYPVALASAEAFGAAAIGNFNTIAPAGIVSEEAFGSATVTPGGVNILPAGITSSEAFGTAQLNMNVTGAGAIASAEAVPSPAVTSLATISPASIGSAEAFGTAALYFLLSVPGIASAEAFGLASFNFTTAGLGAIPSAEAFGTPQLNLTVYPVAIASAEAFGNTRMVSFVYPVAIASAEAFGAAVVRYVLRMRRLKAITYHAIVYSPDANGGPGNPKLELDPDLLNLVWQQNQNLAGQAAFALTRRSKKVDQIEWMVDHVKVFRESSSGVRTVFAGKLVKPILSAIDILCYAWDYLAFLQLSITGYKTLYPSKLIGSEIIGPEWALAKAVSNSPFAFVTTGTVQDPLALDGVTAIKTNATFGVTLFDRLFTFYTIAEMAMANTSNNVKFEITREAPHTFNFWKNYGSAKTAYAGIFPGNLMEYDFDAGKEHERLDLFTVLSDGLGGQVAYEVATADVATSTLRRLQASIPIRTLFGVNTGTTETDQAKAALARQLIVSTRYPRAVRVRPRQGELDLFNGHDLGDTFRHTFERADRAGDFYDGYLRLVGVVGSWAPQHGELIDMYLRGAS